MLEVSNVKVFGFEEAIRGMRNPLNSWKKIDSDWYEDENGAQNFVVGPNDIGLMQRLYRAGTEHRKYMRMIQVYCDITAPLYWWKEFDTYKIGTAANSCSTMHKIAAKEFGIDDFSTEHLGWDRELGMPLPVPKVNIRGVEHIMTSLECMNITIQLLNYYRNLFNETGSKDVWWQLIQLLPTSYNQKRTVMLNYEVCNRIIEQRGTHKLDEWHTLVAEFENLPYMKAIREAKNE